MLSSARPFPRPRKQLQKNGRLSHHAQPAPRDALPLGIASGGGDCPPEAGDFPSLASCAAKPEQRGAELTRLGVLRDRPTSETSDLAHTVSLGAPA